MRATTEKIEGASKVSVEIDLAAFVAEVWQDDDGGYVGDVHSPRQAIIERAAQMLREDIGVEIVKDVRKVVGPEIERRVAAIIRDALDGEFAITNDYGTRGKPTTLREQIGKEAHDWMTKKTGDSYRGGGVTQLAKIVQEMVDRQLAREFTQVIAEERAKIVEQLRAAAAVLLSKEAAKL